MMYVKHKLEIDLSGQAVMPRVDMVEGDQYARQLELSLLCGGESWEIPEDTRRFDSGSPTAPAGSMILCQTAALRGRRPGMY